MIDETWQSASLRIYSSTLTSFEITKILGSKPTRCFEKGELVDAKNLNSQRREQASWILESNIAETENLEKHLISLILFIEEKSNELNQIANQCNIDIFCGLSIKDGQGNFSLSSVIMKKLSTIPLVITFDLYADEE
jgi:hypothetical protein